MSSLREVQTISKSTHILPMPSLTRLPTGGVLNPLKNTTNTSHNELLHQEPLQPPPEPRDIEFSIFVSCVIDGDDGFSILSLAEFPQAAKPAAKTTDRAAARAARRILIA